jgi:hypothetical protein
MLTGTFCEPQTDEDEIEFIAHVPAPPCLLACEGFIFPLRSGQTVSNAYPPMLHDKFNLSWDYAVKRGVLYLTAHTCSLNYLKYSMMQMKTAP